jgi:hypothetical protein
MSPRTDQPTARQLRYLRLLAERTGTTFVNPSTGGQASREIQRLQRLPSTTRSERARERRALDSDRAHLQAASAIEPHEITSYGSHATWAKR